MKFPFGTFQQHFLSFWIWWNDPTRRVPFTFQGNRIFREPKTWKTSTPLQGDFGETHYRRSRTPIKKLASGKKRINTDRVPLPLGFYSYKLKTKTMKRKYI